MNNDEIIATLAAGYQTLQDRQALIEEMIWDSVIVPGKLVIPVLIVYVIICLLVCFTIGMSFFAGY